LKISISRLLRSPVSLIAAALILRSAGFWFGILNIDESDFSLIGRRILDGGLLYVDIVDIKPPLTYFFFTAAGLLGGVSILPVHLLGVAWVVATCLVLRRAALRWTGNEEVGWAAAWLALLASLCEVPSVNSEILMNLPSALALLFFLRAEEGRLREDLICGVFIGVASLFKHQATMLAGALGLALALRLLREQRRRPLLRAGALLGGLSLPWAATVAAYAQRGHLTEFYDWVFIRNFGLANSVAAGSVLTLFLRSTAICVAGAFIPWALAIRETLHSSTLARSPARTAFLLALWTTWLPVCAGGRFYEHYYLQFVPPLALVGAPGAAELLGRWGLLSRFRRVSLVAACLVPAVAFACFTLGKGLTGNFPGQNKSVVELSRWLEANTRPEESLFVWGHYSPIYYLSQRRPGTRYITTSVHMGNFDPEQLPADFDAQRFRSDPDVASTLRDLEARPPAMLVDTAPADIHGWAKVPLSAFPQLRSYVDRHYLEVARPGGAVVYRRRDTAAPITSTARAN
jgi:4-amino-4-deoxy-L-arabinose transferase-like glycosyltransferase